MVVQMETGPAQYQNWEGVSRSGLGSIVFVANIIFSYLFYFYLNA